MQAFIRAVRVDDDAKARRFFLVALIILAGMLAMLPELPGTLKSG